MPLHRVVFLPGVMGSALGHHRLTDAPRDCRVFVARHAGEALGWEAAVVGWVAGGMLCDGADTLWGRAGMLYSARDGENWFDLLNDTDGLADPRGGFVLSDGDGLTRVEVPFGEDFVPYDDMIGRLRKTATTELLVHAYDWRLSNSTNARLLAEAISARWRFGTPPKAAERITIIAHSMGGLIARYYLESAELHGADRVRHLITAGTPHEGAPEMYTHMLGKTQPLVKLSDAVAKVQEVFGGEYAGHLLGPKFQKRLCLKYASLIEMLPVYDFVKNGRRDVPWREVLAGIDLPDHGGKTALDLVLPFRKGLVASEDLPHWLDCVQVRYTAFAATGIDTITGYDQQSGKERREPVGDGTVPMRSAHAGDTSRFPPRARRHRKPKERLTRPRIVLRPTNHEEYANPKTLDHQELLRIHSVRAEVVKLIERHPPSAGQDPDTWLPNGYLHRLGSQAARQRGGARPIVLAIATLTLADPVRQPALRYRVIDCPQVGWTGGCMQGVDGVVDPPQIRSLRLDSVRDYQYVELLSAEPTQANRPTGGILVLPAHSCSGQIKLAGWNTRSHRIDQQLQSNDHHAEVQLLRWIERQDETWRARIMDVELSITHSPCLLCTADLVAALAGGTLGHARTAPLIKPKRAVLSWGRVYQNEPQGLSTTLQHVQDLRAAHWKDVPLDEPVHRFRRSNPMPLH